MVTYGGYVNVSRQNIDWSVPSIMDIVINDLAAQYAIKTESVTAAAVATGSTAQTPVITAAVDGGRGERRDLEGGRRLLHGDEGIRPARPRRVPGHDGRDRGAVPGDEPDQRGVVRVQRRQLRVRPERLDLRDHRRHVGRAGRREGVPDQHRRHRGVRAAARLPPGDRASVLGVQVAYAGYFAPVVLTTTGNIKLTA